VCGIGCVCDICVCMPAPSKYHPDPKNAPLVEMQRVAECSSVLFCSVGFCSVLQCSKVHSSFWDAMCCSVRCCSVRAAAVSRSSPLFLGCSVLRVLQCSMFLSLFFAVCCRVESATRLGILCDYVGGSPKERTRECQTRTIILSKVLLEVDFFILNFFNVLSRRTVLVLSLFNRSNLSSHWRVTLFCVFEQ